MVFLFYLCSTTVVELKGKKMNLFDQLKQYRGAVTEVARLTGYSYPHVKACLEGKNSNDFVRLQGLKVLAKRKGLQGILVELEKLERQILSA